MNEEDFKGFEDLQVKKIEGGDSFWAFKGEDVWSKDITELWRWIMISLEIEDDEWKKKFALVEQGGKE